jgi:hypothetical protein
VYSTQRLFHLDQKQRFFSKGNAQRSGVGDKCSFRLLFLEGENIIKDKNLLLVSYRKDVILTKDNLSKRQYNGFSRYRFCSEQENIQHLFF